MAPIKCWGCNSSVEGYHDKACPEYKAGVIIPVTDSEMELIKTQAALGEGWGTDPSKGGIKHDTEKPRYDLFPPEAYDGICQVLTFGAKKYSPWNWRKGMSWSRVMASTFRHLFAFMRGEDFDPETGLSHIDHAACCLVFLSTYYKTKLGNDDRFRHEGPDGYSG